MIPGNLPGQQDGTTDIDLPESVKFLFKRLPGGVAGQYVGPRVVNPRMDDAQS